MKYKVTVEAYEDLAKPPEPVYDQLVEDLDLAALIRQVNTKKRGPRAGRAKKEA